MSGLGLRFPGTMYPTTPDDEFLLPPADPLSGCQHHKPETGERSTEWAYIGLMNVLYRCTQCGMEWTAFDSTEELALAAKSHGGRNLSDG